jgi:hypothetical protein
MPSRSYYHQYGLTSGGRSVDSPRAELHINGIIVRCGSRCSNHGRFGKQHCRGAIPENHARISRCRTEGFARTRMAAVVMYLQ